MPADERCRMEAEHHQRSRTNTPPEGRISQRKICRRSATGSIMRLAMITSLERPAFQAGRSWHLLTGSALARHVPQAS